MFSTSSIIDNLQDGKGVEYKKLCRLLKLSKKTDKDKLTIALEALEKLEIINKNNENYFSNIDENKHIVAKIRCSSKGYCFAVRDNSKEDIYIKENLLNYALNGDKVLVRIIKEGVRRRSPEGIVDCILERNNQILLAKVELINNNIYGVPIDDRILTKIKLPEEDRKYEYNSDKKNIVKVEIDIFPIGQREGLGHVIKELKLNNNEKSDTDFVLSKSGVNILNRIKFPQIKDINDSKRVDLTNKNAFMFKSWKLLNSPILPIIHLDQNNDETQNLWIHTNAIAERIDLSTKKNLEIFIESSESLPLLDKWQNYLDQKIIDSSKFNEDEINEAISLCINLNKNNEILNWSFHLTKVKCSLVVENKHLEALLNRKNKQKITSRILKPIKEYIEELDRIIDVSTTFRNNHLSKGRIEIPQTINSIDSLSELYINNPSDYSKEYFEPLNKNDVQTYLTPLLYEANLIWFTHANKLKLSNASYISQDLDYINVAEIIKNSELIESNIELNESGTLTFRELVDLCNDDNKKRILHKLLINVLRNNEISLITKDSLIEDSGKNYIAPWTLPSYDFNNLINQFNLYNLIANGKRTGKTISKSIEITEKDSLNIVNWNIYSPSVSKNLDLIFNNFVINKINEYKNKVKFYRSNMISIKQVRKAEELIGNIYNGLIMTVQSYGFFVEIPELYVEGLVHVSTLSNDWYEYRSRQNLLIGRKSKKSYKIGDRIDVKILKVDILKYQIDLELV